jgi:hypothetical protein
VSENPRGFDNGASFKRAIEFHHAEIRHKAGAEPAADLVRWVEDLPISGPDI